MSSYRVSEEAQLVMGLHAAQYPQFSVTGLLVGRDSGNTIEVLKAFPVCHQSPTAPLFEFASTSIEVEAAKLKLKIVGLYVANSRVDDSSLGPVHARIASTVEANATRSCVLVLDNQALASANLWLKDIKRGWVRVDNRLVYEDDDGKLLVSSLEKRSQLASIADATLQVVDFDEHLEQLAKDWRNPQVLALARLQV
ncbi:hypothetical protein H257_11779 [Aphanomyces astaci]|uniref:MPN domain-containing protein n=1 Tax=Aphanomyces astaci TaxID=112090 RepID=W4G1X1_APHAT|nr:hypothetical protein H257_11779 [Aphanomyces astaci]ETV73680.1 hypothetical protein H257_11779 [Aphanomyces astaci]RHY05546.1 hypothetical protein DYB25_010751 [Aphanomyces astaci]RHY20717.1 hypothetical protein DYB36_008608 [Aphanomyces astaci]RHY46002.1 hypothetical protein DYB34_011226 [Aphanomyces astaci]RHY55286.1 hypothetical protein DYB38_003917 [Aphanomyces astaci]|eukprot:XP_009837106.1 hypothetical protein H257_11779 [Aphanomyces astaci]